MKKTKLNKTSKQPISKIQRQLWEECKRIIRARYPHHCYTCPKINLEGSNLHTGHIPWPKGSLGAFLKYDLRILRPQCYNCNINLGGMGAVGYQKMLKEIGKAKMKKLEQDKNVTVQAYDHYVMLLEKYRGIQK